jgi:hypothetical protein
MSIQQTKALETIKPPYIHEVETPSGQPQEYPHEVSSNLEVRKGEAPTLLQTQDSTRFFVGAENEMSRALQEGSVSNAELGDVSLDRTAVWITEQTEIRTKVLTPRLDCIGDFYQDLAALIIKEYQSQKFVSPKPIGKAGFKKSYRPTDLGDPDIYSVEYKLVPSNKRQQMADFSLGTSLRGMLSEDTIIRNIFQLDDPDGELDKKYSEEARKSNPVIFYFDLSNRLLDISEEKTGDDKKRYTMMAKVMADSMVAEVKKQQIGQGEAGTQGMQPKQGNPQGLLALPSMTKGLT